MSRAALANVARALGGDVVGHQVLCPGPNHSPRDRSLSVHLSPSAPDGFVVFSHAGDDPFDAKDYVRRRLGWVSPSWQPDRAVETLRRRKALASEMSCRRDIDAGKTSCRREEETNRRRLHVDADKAAKIGRAVAIWNEGVDPKGTLVERYLASRGLVIPGEAAGEAIRFHPACPWRDEVSGRTIRVPAMVAAMRSIATEDITGVHRTRLTHDGHKVDRRMLGKASGAAVMLTPMSAVGAGLAIGEGIETCIAGMMMGWASAWALGSVGAIERFPLVTGLQSLTMFAETGDNGASQRAIDVVGNRYATAGREVIMVEPRCTGDINDALRGAA